MKLQGINKKQALTMILIKSYVSFGSIKIPCVTIVHVSSLTCHTKLNRSATDFY